MSTPRVLVLAACAAALAACAAGEPEQGAAIGDVFEVKSTFGPEFQVTTAGPTAIDAKLLAPQAIPAGVKVEPAGCAKFAAGLAIPPGAQGNMAATTAEGKGNRFIAIAVETSEPIPFNDPGPACQKVGYGGPGVRGLVEVVESPQIEGVRTLGTHRIVQTVVDGKPHSGELFNYVASFDSQLVIVTANPLVLPNTPVAPVDTQKARDLLVAAVAAVRG
ncbi:MAG: DUF5642 family protein [Mycobacterium sp.]